MSMKQKQEYDKNVFIKNMKEEADMMVSNHKQRVRNKKLAEIKFKLGNNLTYEEINNYLEFQIEDTIQYFHNNLTEQDQYGLK